MNQTRELSRTATAASSYSFLSRLSRKGPEQNDDPKGPLGLTTVYEPSPGVVAVADIIFVHGLNGGSHSTWSKGNQWTHFWPKEWLPLDDAFQDVRIHTFGYPSTISRESILNVHDFARSLLAAVNDSPSIGQSEKTRLIFVAHSMGGLVVKKAFILGQQDHEFKPLVDRICSLFFLGTPHQGAGIAQTLTRLINLVPGARPFVDDLLPQSAMLQSINEDFPRFCSNVQLLSFYETRPMTIGMTKALIVEKTSAVMNLPNERRTLLDADHRNCAMFSSVNESAYVTVRNALATVVSTQRSTSRSHIQSLAQEDQAALNSFLSVSSPPEDDIMTQDSLRLPGSCEWISGNRYYRSWEETLDPRFLWLRGRPGAGKSVLTGHIVNDLREKGYDPCFFFFQASDNTKSTVNAFLRSMAWQMAMIHRDVQVNLKQVMTEFKGEPVDKVDHTPLWRKAYLSGILKVKLERPQFWVIDAMDECKGITEMMNFLARIQEQWPVSLLVTCRDPVEIHLSNANPRIDICSYTITEEDSKQDISLFLSSNIQQLPRLASGKWSSPADMASQIVDSSGGCFLWASLICSELREVISEREAETVLDSIPSDMDALYSKILADMEVARFGKDIAKAFVIWATYAFRPLTTVEIQEPIEMDIDDKIDDVERAISKCCGNMVYVDSHGKIRFVHSTAREFLTSKKAQSNFAVSKADGHRRLAMVCLRYLIQMDKSASKARRLGSDSEVRTLHSSSSTNTPRARRLASDPEVSTHHGSSMLGSSPIGLFTEYASTFLFPHLNQVHTTDEGAFVMLSKFLGSTSVLRWIEFVAENGDLRTIYQAGKTINSMLARRARHSPPVGLSRGQKHFPMLEKWGDDLIHLVTKFSRWLRLSPKSIHHLIPAFCPPESAIRQQFANPYRGLSVQGLSARGWDDCLTTITFDKGSKPNAIATGPGFFAVGMMTTAGKVMVYDDSIFQEAHVVLHGEPVWRLAFSENGAYFASAGGKAVRIWSSEEGTQMMNFSIPSLCLALSFGDEDFTLRVATRQNQLIEWDLEREEFFQDEPSTWTTDLEDTIQARTPTVAGFGPGKNLLCVIYRGEDLILWDYMDSRIFDVYAKETGSVSLYESHKIGEGATTVRAVSLSHDIDSNLLAATYTDGDLVVYDLENGQRLATAEGANTMVIASSYDSRTLAGVDSRGNLTLFEFDTLRALYRVQFDTRILPKALAFTSDSLRFIEIRGDQCRVWGPTVLLRTDYGEEENSDTISVSSGPQEVDYQSITGAHITTITCCTASNVVICAMEDGSVHAYDISGEPQSNLLFVQTQGCPINLLYLDETSLILACGDLSGRVTARKVVRRTVPRQTGWDVHKELLVDTRSPALGLLKQILVSGQHSRLLTCTDNFDTLWPMPKQGEGVWISQAEGSINPRWLPHPTESEYLIRVEASTFSLCRWSDLSTIRSVKVAMDGTFDRLASLQHTQYFATISNSSSSKGKNKKSCIRVWDMKEMENVTDVMTPSNQLHNISSNTELVIGAFGARMVIYTADSWVASVDLAPASLTEDSLMRHFLIPTDWASAGPMLTMGVGRTGEILFAKRSELAVIKRGLEVTESGASFNPRRGSASNTLLHSRRPSNQTTRRLSPSPGASPSRPSLPHR